MIYSYICLRENNKTKDLNMIYSYICLRENNKTKEPKHDLQLHMFEREQ